MGLYFHKSNCAELRPLLLYASIPLVVYSLSNILPQLSNIRRAISLSADCSAIKYSLVISTEVGLCQCIIEVI